MNFHWFVLLDICWLVLLVFFCYKFIRDLNLINNSKKWPSVEGIIRHCELLKQGSGYWPHVEYEYLLENKKYISQRIHIDTFHLGPKDLYSHHAASRLLNGYEKGKNVSIYYEPLMPELSVLQVGAPRKFYILVAILAVLILLQIGVIVLRFNI